MIQVLEFLKVLLSLCISIAFGVICLASAMWILSSLPSLLVVYEGTRPTTIPMLHSTHNETVAGKLRTQTAVRGPRATQAMAEH